MRFTLRPAVPEDYPAIFDLILELASFQNNVKKVSNSPKQMKKEQAYFNFLVAEQDEEIVGMACYYYVYFTWVGKSLYLDDLFVKESHRNKGIGKALLEKIIKIGKKESCYRIRWQVSEWNTTAISLYKKMGAAIDEENRNCDITLNYNA